VIHDGGGGGGEDGGEGGMQDGNDCPRVLLFRQLKVCVSTWQGMISMRRARYDGILQEAPSFMSSGVNMGFYFERGTTV
jgi:hypothetical protein